MEENEMNNVPNNNGKYQKDGESIASMILGIVSIVLAGFIGLVCGILALVFGIRSNKKQKNAMATTGIITAIVGLSLSGLYLACVACGTCISIADYL